MKEPDLGILCGRCYEDTGSEENLFNSGCQEKPELLIDRPIGQYGCPDCGAMVLAGHPHPLVCERCKDRKHPHFDNIDV